MRASLHIVLLLLLTGPSLLHAQPQPYTFDHLTTADGLATYAVNKIYQDSQGFMWFATNQGLQKYDGYRFTTYRHDPGDPASLSHDTVLALCEDHEGALWIGTRRGLDRFDRATEIFAHYRRDEDGPHSLSSNVVSAVYEDRAGTLWVGTNGGGLNRFDQATETFTRYLHDPEDPGSLSYNGVNFIHESRSGVLWVGASRGGLNRFDPATETFTSYPFLNTTYDPEVGRLLDTLEGGDRRLASILRVGEETMLTQPLTLTEETTALVVAVGEGETMWGDYGWVENSAGDVVWRMALDHTRHAGGSLKNRMQVGLVTLPPGAFRLHYQSDTGHAYDAWNEPPPDHPERYGIQLFRVTAAEAQRLSDYVSDDKPPYAVWGFLEAILEDREGALWLGTSPGLYRFDPATETFTQYQHDPNDPNSLSMGGRVTAVQEARDGALWIGGVQNPSPYGSRGLTRFDPTTNTFTRFLYDPTDPGGFLGNRVRDVYVDRAGAVWVAAERFGINRLDPSKDKFTGYRYDPNDPHSLSHHVIWAVHESRDGTLWIGTDAGLDRLDRRTGRITHYTPNPADPYSLSYSQVKTIYEDREGVLWVGTWGGGLNRFDRATGRFTAYRHDPNDSTSISLDRVEDILEDSQGVLWVSTNDGFNRFDRATETFTRYTTKNISFEGEPTNQIGVLFGAVYEDAQGVLWVGTQGGLNRFDRSTGQLRLNALGMANMGNMVNTIEEDRAGRLWVGSEQGLFLVDRATGQVEAFTEADGLPQDAVMGIVSDEAGALWLSTGSKGLTRFNPDTGAVRTYDLGDGLPSLNYNRTATFQSKSGEVFFAGPGGVVAFHPERMQGNPYVPPVVLTGFTMRNEPAPVGEDAPLQAHISVAEAITLAHDQNDVAFEFAALNYTNPEKNRYAYTLEGYDETWTEAGTSRQARYTNIPPGDYTFRVKGANNDGVWNEEGASIRLTVLPPFWQTAWFRLLVIASVLGLAYAGYRWRIRSLEARSRMLETQVAERTAEVRAQAEQLHELDRVKSRFFANISHEFRTPLTLMLGPLRDALDGAFGDLDERLQHQHHMMHRNGRRLLRLINQLLDLSRLEAGHLTLRPRRANLVPLVRATTQAFSSMAQRKNVTLHVDVPQQEALLYFEPDKLEKVLFNLLSNAFKFTPEHGKILVSVAEDGDQDAGYVEIVVRDTGHGIPAEELPFIFDRFYQVDASSTREQGGSGIGLALTKELVALHGGTVRVESKESFGTAFFVRLPKGRAHLGDDDIVEAVAGDAALEAVDEETSLHAIDDVLAAEARVYEHAGDGRTGLPAEDAPVILIVEDNADVRGYLGSHLAADYRIVEAVDGIEGLEQARARQPALILADVMMPRLDGYELCREVKADEQLNHIPVVLLTAKADEASKIEGLEAGADDYLYKPFNRAELLTRVENLIEIRRLLRSRFSGEVVVQPTAITVPSADAVFLEQVRQVVEAQMGESHFTVDRLAEGVGMSTRQLQRRLRELTKLSPSGYVRTMRLQRAAQLLEQQAGRVSEVAYAVGFQNAEHFSRLFQQVYGVAPSQYEGDQT